MACRRAGYLRTSLWGVVEDDLRKGNKAILNFLEEVPSAQVHLIFDFQAVVQACNELHYLQHPRLGWVVTFERAAVSKA